jgi:formamidopyrimidine-DNA glycosylase
MPELPDVAVFGRYIEDTCGGQRIEDVEVNEPKVLQGISKKDFRRQCIDNRIEQVDRHGKNLFLVLKKNGVITMHFGMTGRPEYFTRDDAEPEYSAILFHFTNSHSLAYTSVRKIGRVGIVAEPSEYIKEHIKGIDALEIDRDRFAERIHSSRGVIKTTLMNQDSIAGIGNIYSDEILFNARIHPQKKASSLTDRQIDSLYDTARTVLYTAIERDAEPKKLPRTYLLRHRTENANCPRCKSQIRKISISGRSAYFCPHCQDGK